MSKPSYTLTGTLLLGLCGAGCEAQATDEYKGDALLRLKGQATVEVSTGGLGVQPALCFLGPVQTRPSDLEVATPDQVPPQVADLLQPSTFWIKPPATILEVDSVGQFPADFNVSVYTPPPEASPKPLFSGEPRIATGSVCAVSAGHPEVVFMPLLSRKLCVAGEAPCERSILRVFRDSQRFYGETYDCPTSDSVKEDCTVSSLGDPSVKREDFEYMLGRDDKQVLYLAERAPAGSYTAWKFGTPEGLSAGYHLFSRAVSSDACTLQAYSRAYSENNEEFKGHLVTIENTGLTDIDPAYADAYYDALGHRVAEATMQDCEVPDITEYSPDEPLSITINRDSAFTAFPSSEPALPSL